MVDTLRSGTKAAETMLGGMGGGIAYSVVQDGRVPLGKFKMIFLVTIVLMALFILLHKYYEWREGENTICSIESSMKGVMRFSDI